MMKNKKGFTLTEILLAVMIVGIIGVALAALTTAASRESGVGRSKVLLRNNLSIALRQLRRDIKESSRVLYVRGTLGSIGTTEIPLLMVGKNVDQDGQRVSSVADPVYVTYCFERGGLNTTTVGAAVLPSGAYDGGVITRYETKNVEKWAGNIPECAGDSSSKFLNNVKYIPSSRYAAPLFAVRGFSGTYNVKDSGNLAKIRKNLGSVLDVNLITELNSNPVVNDVTEETFILPNGFGIKQ
ncbi:MAG: type II secretion system protein [Elusimicrobiaceae bacterium]|nr:type II secretion system protein [Elusimicrobiaceae bacterium]